MLGVGLNSDTSESFSSMKVLFRAFFLSKTPIDFRPSHWEICSVKTLAEGSEKAGFAALSMLAQVLFSTVTVWHPISAKHCYSISLVWCWLKSHCWHQPGVGLKFMGFSWLLIEKIRSIKKWFGGFLTGETPRTGAPRWMKHSLLVAYTTFL